MKVYVVTHGEVSEGGKVMGVYRSREVAVQLALTIPTYTFSWKEEEPGYWTNGCDFIQVTEHKVL